MSKRPLVDIMASAEWKDGVGKVLTALEHAYDDARDDYSPDKGSDGLTFGVELSRFARWQVSETNVFPLMSWDPLRFNVANTPTALHRVGKYVAAEPGLPRKRHGWTPTHQRQSLLPFGDSAPAYGDTLVLAHVGNEEAGFCGLYLARAFVDEFGHLVRWEEHQPVYLRPAGQPAQEQPRIEQPKPAEEKSAPARVTRIKKGPSSSPTGGQV